MNKKNPQTKKDISKKKINQKQEKMKLKRKTNCKQQHEAKIIVKQGGRNKDVAKGKK